MGLKGFFSVFCQALLYGNNNTLVLKLSLREAVELVEVTDSWEPDPTKSPITLHRLDGTLTAGWCRLNPTHVDLTRFV